MTLTAHPKITAFATFLAAPLLAWAGVFLAVFLPMPFEAGLIGACLSGIGLGVWLLPRAAGPAKLGLTVGLGQVGWLAVLVGLRHAIPPGLDTLPALLLAANVPLLLLVAGAPLAYGVARLRRRGMAPVVEEPATRRSLAGRVRALGGGLVLVIAAFYSALTLNGLAAVLVSRGSLGEALSAAQRTLGFSPLPEWTLIRAHLRDGHLVADKLTAESLALVDSPERLQEVTKALGDPYSHAERRLAGPPPSPIGITMGPADKGRRRIAFVEPGSPAERAGLARGQVVTSCVDLAESDPDWGEHCRAPAPGIRDIATYPEEGRRAWKRIPVGAKPYKWTPPVLTDQVGNRKVAYVMLPWFDDEGAGDFESAAKRLRAKGVNDLVLDLRANPGGSTSAMARVAAVILGREKSANMRIVEHHRNARYANSPLIVQMPALDWEGLNLSRLVVLTAKQTASSSEALIVALREYIPVTTIGETTAGKGVGCAPVTLGNWDVCVTDSRWTSPKGATVPAAGLVPDVPVADDPRIEFGHSNDPARAAAMQRLSQP